MPEELGGNLTGAPDVVAYNLDEYGWLMWVPDDPERYDVPTAVLAVQVLARAWGCDYVLFDCDGPVEPRLPTWDW